MLVGAGATAFARVHTDTRSLREGDLFVALRGERFDGTTSPPQAHGAGAVAALAERGLPRPACRARRSPTAAPRSARWPARGGGAWRCR